MFRRFLVEVRTRDRIARQRLGDNRERLGRRGLFAGHLAGWNGPILDRVDRFTGHPVEEEHQPSLVDDAHRGDGLTVLDHVEQGGRSLGVVIPDVMSNHLEVPDILARASIGCDDRTAEQIVARTVAAIAIVVRRAEGHVDDAAFGIDRHLTPDVDA
ncbi:hypothetical protein D3C73_1057270 [compost metagenome]